jgi:hypothetical protein
MLRCNLQHRIENLLITRKSSPNERLGFGKLPKRLMRGITHILVAQWMTDVPRSMTYIGIADTAPIIIKSKMICTMCNYNDG